jgi:hypothetical protein
MNINQRIRADIVSPFEDIDVMSVVVHRLARIHDQMQLSGYWYKRGDYFVSDGSGTCIYRPAAADFDRVWAGGEWANEHFIPPFHRASKAH